MGTKMKALLYFGLGFSVSFIALIFIYWTFDLSSLDKLERFSMVVIPLILGLKVAIVSEEEGW